MTFCGMDVVIQDEVYSFCCLIKNALVCTSSGGLGELIDIYSFPSKTMFCAGVGKTQKLGSHLTVTNLGMTMCLSITCKKDTSQFILAAGYESGHACIYDISPSSWSLIYTFQSHSQPVLSLAIHPSQESFYTSSADAHLVQHPIAIASQPLKSVNTKHSGQTSLRIRDDGRIIVSAGWDGCGRVYSSTTLRQVAVLKWHNTGLQAAGFSGSIDGKYFVYLGGKDGKITLWDVFN
jgi:ASTRA-associated protein 1